MSLILEALKKLERDKQIEGRSGFLVMAARPWPGPGGDRRWVFLGVAAGALVMMGLGAALASWLWRASVRPHAAPAAAQAAAGPASVAVPPPVVAAAAVPPAPPIARRTEAPAVVPPAAVTDERPADPVEPAPLRIAPSAAAPASGSARFRLTAISERDGKPVAVLNDRLVQEGDSFDGVTVVRIGEGEVELKVDGKPLVVRF